jgi:hypothetical protein
LVALWVCMAVLRAMGAGTASLWGRCTTLRRPSSSPSGYRRAHSAPLGPRSAVVPSRHPARPPARPSTHAHARTHARPRMPTHARTPTRAHIHALTHAYAHAYAHIYTHARVNTRSHRHAAPRSARLQEPSAAGRTYELGGPSEYTYTEFLTGIFEALGASQRALARHAAPHCNMLRQKSTRRTAADRARMSSSCSLTGVCRALGAGLHGVCCASRWALARHLHECCMGGVCGCRGRAAWAWRLSCRWEEAGMRIVS